MDTCNKKPRLRAPNFTASDNMLLCEIVAKFKHIIENKKTDSANLQEKHAAWFKVLKMYNSSTTGCIRTLESLQQTYKNLKRKAKKNASDAKMIIPVDKETLIQNIEEYGTTSNGWQKVAENTGVSQEICQDMFAAMSKEADANEKILKKKVMGTGGGPPPSNNADPVLEKVKVLVGPVIDGKYTIYDGDSDIMASQNIPPIEGVNIETEQKPRVEQTQTDSQYHIDTPYSKEFFTNDRANLKKTPHHLLTCKRKLNLRTPSQQTVADKFKSLANEKLELVELQRELLKTQLEEEKEKLEHNRILRTMEIEEMKRKYAHNEIMRQLEIKRFGN